MKRRLGILIDFYAAQSALLFLTGMGVLLLRLLNIGPDALTSIAGLVLIGVGLPLRLHSQTSGLNILLEEERQITHRRLSKLEDPVDS